VDAIANYVDALFFPLIENETALLYSLRSGDNTQGSGADVGDPVQYERLVQLRANLGTDVRYQW